MDFKGAGKTTTCAKLALKARDVCRRPLLVVADLNLPGTVNQLKAKTKSNNVLKKKKMNDTQNKRDFTLIDFRAQFANIQKIGLKDLMGNMPGMSEMIPEGEDPEVALRKVKGMIDSMTKQERLNPATLDVSHRERIAAGSGVQVEEVDQFLRQFELVRQIMKQMLAMTFWQRLKMMAGFGKLVPLHRACESNAARD